MTTNGNVPREEADRRIREARNQYVGSTPVDEIAAAIVHVAQLRRLSPATLTTLDQDAWRELVAAAFGADAGCVRLAVIMRLCHEESCS